MSILIECPICHKKHATKNKICDCGQDLDKAKRSKKVRYWISYRLPGGTQRREFVGSSIEEARDADGKRRGQKREGRIFEMLPDSKLTFRDISDWYLKLSPVLKLTSYPRIKIALTKFNTVFGQRVTGTILPIELEEYQAKRIKDGIIASTLDVELNIVRGMVSKAFDNDKMDGRTIKAFRRVKSLTRRGDNARKRTIGIEEYKKLVAAALKHFRGMLIIAMNTGMRPGELRQLRWEYIDRKAGFIRLPADFTKERREKAIPINHHVKLVLDGQIRHLHHDFVFTYGRDPITGSAACKGALRGSCKRAGLPYGRKTGNGLTMHDFRRTVKTNMLEAGMDKTYRDLILGHSLEGMDRHYIKPSEQTLRQAMAKYTAWLDEKLETVDHTVDLSAVSNS